LEKISSSADALRVNRTAIAEAISGYAPAHSMPQLAPLRQSEQQLPQGLTEKVRDIVYGVADYLARGLHIKKEEKTSFTVGFSDSDCNDFRIRRAPCAFYQPDKRNISFTTNYLMPYLDPNYLEKNTRGIKRIAAHEDIHHLQHTLTPNLLAGARGFMVNEAVAKFGEALFYYSESDFAQSRANNPHGIIRVSYFVGSEAAYSVRSLPEEKKFELLERMLRNPDQDAVYRQLVGMSGLANGVWNRISFEATRIFSKISYSWHQLTHPK
jgi:hypothetical protein